MSWLAGILGGVGITGVVTLGIYIARLAINNRTDLHKLIEATKDTADARRDLAAEKVQTKDLKHALAEKIDELVRERAALAVARKTMESVATRSDAAGVVDDLNRALGVLSNLSETAPTPSDHR